MTFANGQHWVIYKTGAEIRFQKIGGGLTDAHQTSPGLLAFSGQHDPTVALRPPFQILWVDAARIPCMAENGQTTRFLKSSTML